MSQPLSFIATTRCLKNVTSRPTWILWKLSNARSSAAKANWMTWRKSCKTGWMKFLKVSQFRFLHRLSLGYPNTYVLSKALSEDLLMSYEDQLAIVIVRPSMVSCAINEPIEGYVEGLGVGFSGMIAGVMSSAVRNLPNVEDAPVNFTPVDFAANAIIAAAWKQGLSTTKCLKVFNCSCDEKNVLTWKRGKSMLDRNILKYPSLEKLLWYPRFTLTSNLVLHKINLYLFQILPAVFFDLVFRINGRKPM